MTLLNFYNMTDIDKLAHPEENSLINLNSPAIDFFTDFEKVKPSVIEFDTLAVDVKKIMLKAHINIMFVLNKLDEFIGIISIDELNDREIIRKLSEGYARDEILVADLMIHKADLHALNLRELKHASINNVIETLKNNGEQHCLVFDKETHRICGIFSAFDISKKLHLPIDIRDNASFYKVFTHTK